MGTTLLAQLLDRVWQDAGSTVAVKPREPFARCFQTVADVQGLKEIPDTQSGVPSRRAMREQVGA